MSPTSVRRPLLSARRRTAAVVTSAIVVGAMLASGIGIGISAASANTVGDLSIHLTTSSGSAAAGAEVMIERVVNGAPNPALLNFADQTPGKTGLYEFNDVPSGTYALELFGTSQKGTSSQWLGGAQNPDASQFIQVNAGPDSIDASYAASGTISGKATNSSGKAVKNACITMWDFDGSQWNAIYPEFAQCSATTNSSGNYSFNPGAAGSYKLEFDASSPSYIDQFADGSTDLSTASSFFVGAGSSVTVNAHMVSAGKIAGTLLDSGDHGLSAQLSAYRLIGNPTDGFTGSSAIVSYYAFPMTAADGSFTVASLPAGYYSLHYTRFDDGSSNASGYIGGADALSATEFVVTAGHTTAAGTTVFGSVSTNPVGVVVTDDSSDPIDNLDGDVTLVSEDSGNGYYAQWDSASSKYIADSVPDGSYRLSIDAYSPDSGQLLYQPYLGDSFTVNGAAVDTAAQLDAPTALAFTTDSSIDIADPMVGVPVTATPGETNLTSADSTLTYQWFRVVDGQDRAIRGATAAEYTPTGGDVGKTLRVRITYNYLLQVGGRSLYEDSVSTLVSSSAPVVEGDSLTPLTTITLSSSSVAVGQRVRVTAGPWTAPNPQLAYKWYRITDGSDTAQIPGATASWYTPTAADDGTFIFASVTATKDGYADGVEYDSLGAALVVDGSAPTVTKAPKITEKTVSGQHRYSVSSGTWSRSGAQFSYEWSVDGDGVFAGPTFTATVPGFVSVTVTATEDGYVDGTWTGVAAKGPSSGLSAAVTDPDPVLADSQEEVGHALQAGYATDTYADGSTPTSTQYQWQRKSGSKWSSISHATGNDYTVTSSDVGHALRVAMTASSPHYSTAVVYADAGVGELNNALAEIGAVTIAGDRPIGGTLTADVSGFDSGVSHKYVWQYSTDSGGTWLAIPKATSSSVTLASPVAVGNLVRVVVTVSHSGSEPTTRTSNQVTVLGATITSLTEPTISPSGTRVQGTTLTAKAGTWTPSSVTVTYQWYRQVPGSDAELIPGATSKTHKTTAADAGELVYVETTAHRSHYTDSDGADSDVVYILADTLKPDLAPADFGFGSVQYGETVSAPGIKDEFDLPNDEYVDYTTVSYSWKLDGHAIKGATHSTYAPTSSTVNKDLTLTITLKSPVYHTATVTSSPSTVAAGDSSWYNVSVTPYSDVAPGIVLHAGVPHSTTHYQWQYSTDDTNWVNISGATKSTYTVKSTDVGRYLRIGATLAQSGYDPVTEYAETDAVEYYGSIGQLTAPTLIGTPQVGVAEKVATGVWDTSGVSFTYQWLLDGTAIPGATSSTFTPIGYQAGGDLSVQLVVKRTGYVSASDSTDGKTIAVGAAPTVSHTHPPTITGTPTSCSTLSVSSGTWSVSGLTISYQWLVNGVAAELGSGSTFSPPVSAEGLPVSVQLTARKAGYAPTTVTVGPTANVQGCV